MQAQLFKPKVRTKVSIPYQTEERLKGYLDSNQLHRERLCLGVLSIDRRYSDVRPRQPRGGPDGGRDVEAVFQSELKTYGAIGFLNQANDSTPQKTQIRNKFSDDLASALEAEPDLGAFVFFTNIDLTVGEEEALIAEAREGGVRHCEIFDRERIRVSLDSPDGFAIRFQYLGLALSEAEQASFFARWGDDIQSLVASGFQRVEKLLDRLLFLEESRDAMSYLTVAAELDREYEGAEIGHVRFFCSVYLKEVRHGILGLLLGVFDRAFRLAEENRLTQGTSSGIEHGFGGAQWQNRVSEGEPEDSDEEEDRYFLSGSLQSRGRKTLKSIATAYRDDSWIRFEPGIALRDLNEASWILFCNRSLASRIATIRVYAGGYELDRIERGGFAVDESDFPADFPIPFSEQELEDRWVRIRPASGNSTFDLRFYSTTPKRLAVPSHFSEGESGNAD